MADVVADLIRSIPDHPKPGILYRDITPLLASASGLQDAVTRLAAPWVDAAIDLVVGIEARGFIFGTPVAGMLEAGFAPMRKAGKLPFDTFSQTYELEYGTDTLEIHVDSVAAKRVLIIDDVLATGGTAAAAAGLIARAGGELVGMGFLVEIGALGGRDRLPSTRVEAVVRYD